MFHLTRFKLSINGKNRQQAKDSHVSKTYIYLFSYSIGYLYKWASRIYNFELNKNIYIYDKHKRSLNI